MNLERKMKRTVKRGKPGATIGMNNDSHGPNAFARVAISLARSRVKPKSAAPCAATLHSFPAQTATFHSHIK